MKKFDIWSEGFAATGENGEATFHGTISGEDFEDACCRFCSESEDFSGYFNQTSLTYWGCRLFDNEAEARSRYG